MARKLRSILCVHQGYELYGSDRSFVLSVSVLKEVYPTARIIVMIPKDGPIRRILEPVCDELIINSDLAILRKKDVKENPVRLIKKIIIGVKSAIQTSVSYDLVYINTVVVADFILASRFIKCPVIVHVREIPFGIQKLFFSILLLVSKAKLIFNSFNTQKSYSLLGTKKQYVLHNGVSGFNDITDAVMSDKSINILMLGRLTPWKGQLFLLRALEKLTKNEDCEIQLRIVGEPFDNQTAYEESLKDFVATKCLDNIVHFRGFTENPREEYEWSDLVVIPSIKPEPFGRVAIEAMSAKRCVIAADHGGLSEIVTNRVDGVLFTPNDINSFVKEISSIIRAPESMSELAERAQLTFSNKFSDTAYRKNFRDILLDVV